jgi:hypothetical protein
MVQSASNLEEQFIKHRMQSNIYTPEQTADYLNSLPVDMRILLTSAATHVTVSRHIIKIMVDKIREHDDDEEEEPSPSLN